MSPGAVSPDAAGAQSERSAQPLRALIIGGSGQIGGWLLHVLAARGHSAVGSYASVPCPGLRQLDAADLPATAQWIRSQGPDVVFYPAGFTWVDGCESDPKRAYAANLEQPLNAARAALESQARFVYLSTDYVFDGREGPYDEDSPTHPLSVYGRAKRDAERELAAALGDRLLTVRTSWVFGPERQGKNFAYQLLRNLAAGKEVACPSDQVSSPSYGPDVARALVALAEREVSGLIHVAGPEVLDRLAFARGIARAFDHDPALIQGAPTAALGQGAPRPLKGGLLTHRLEALAPGIMRSFPAALEDFKQRLADPSLSGWLRPIHGSEPAAPSHSATEHSSGGRHP